MSAPTPAAKTERLLNLVICLLYTRQPLSKQRIRAAVPQYGEAASDEAFDRMFERDKDELRDLGIPPLEQHDALNEKWFAYELDLATLIEYPLMTDMREPLTLAFHRARVRADDLRPESDSAAVGTAEASMSAADFAEYRDAVGDYAAAFDAAEREARRRKQTGFSPIEREALDRARKLINVAADTGAYASGLAFGALHPGAAVAR